MHRTPRPDVHDRRRPRGPSPRLRRDAHHRRGHLGRAARPRARDRRCCAAPSSSASTSSTPPTPTARTSREELIAEALHPYPDGLVDRDEGRPRAHAARTSGRATAAPSTCAQACEGSLRRLRLERIDLYQLHAPDPEVPYEESVGALKELQDEGKIRHVGVSNVSVEQLATRAAIVEVVARAEPLQPRRPPPEDVLDACEQRRHRLHPVVPARRGRARHAGAARSPRSPRDHDATPGQVALAWLLHTLAGDAADPGHRRRSTHLEENVAAAELRLDRRGARAPRRAGLSAR